MVNISKTIQTLEGLVFTAMVPYGEYLQNEVLLKQREYDWSVGHLTNIGIGGAVVTWVLMLVGNGRGALRNALIIPTAISSFDLLSTLHPRISFDWQDIACYYGSALFSYGVNYVCNRKL